MEELVKRINEVRDYYKLSGRALAIKLGLKYTTVNNYLNGVKAPSAEFLVALKSIFLDISADWLLVGEGSMFKEKQPSYDSLMKELAAAKMELLVQKGITEGIKDILVGKLHNAEAAGHDGSKK